MTDPAFYQLYAFVMIGAALAVFAVLDGFDLGIGMMLPFFRRPQDKRIMVQSIWPFWDGNELWALIGGGGLFALFPDVFATLLSLLYPIVVLLLVALLFRPVTFELWYHDERGRRVWEWSFFATSVVITFVFGAVYGLTLSGLPFTAEDKYLGSLLAVLRPMPILTALLFVAAFLMHGSAYLVTRSQDDLQAAGRRVFAVAWPVFVTLLVVWFLAGMFTRQAWGRPLPVACGVVSLLLAIVLGLFARRGGSRRIMVLSGLTLASLFPVLGALQYPVVLVNSAMPAASLTLADASPVYTLKFVAVLGTVVLSVVAVYTFFVYRIFRGKVLDDGHGY